MTDVDEQGIIAERGALIAEITYLAFLVNSTTEYCVFVDFSGHVDLMIIRIAASKERYNDEIASTEFYTRYAGDQPWKITPMDSLRVKRDHLRNILDTGELDPSGMEVVRTMVETYNF